MTVTLNELAVLGIVILAGLVRGITGFGGAMLMAAPLSFLIGPVPTVVTALILETTAALIMFPDAWPRINKRILVYLTIPACFTVPISGYLLVTLDPWVARKLIAAVVVLFSSVLLAGLRYTGPQRPLTSLILALQLPFWMTSESMGNHDSEIVDAGSVD